MSYYPTGDGDIIKEGKRYSSRRPELPLPQGEVRRCVKSIFRMVKEQGNEREGHSQT